MFIQKWMCRIPSAVFKAIFVVNCASFDTAEAYLRWSGAQLLQLNCFEKNSVSTLIKDIMMDYKFYKTKQESTVKMQLRGDLWLPSFLAENLMMCSCLEASLTIKATVVFAV